jgi:hypothetical protein
MHKNTALIITSVAAPNAVMKTIAEGSKKNNIDFIVIGDSKSPADFKLEGCRFFSIEEQKKLNFKIVKDLPLKHYSRKNIGYLLAAKNDVIIETDDDNFPTDDFWLPRIKNQAAELINDNGWTNAYKYFSDDTIWPRGFPLENILDDNSPSGKTVNIDVPIQQGLADENPDVDAVYRMTGKLPVSFKKRNAIALGKNSWCPFNSQNTTWFKESFPLLYLPSYCSFRMTDIWRSFIAQRIAWTCDWPVLFHQSTVWQERNEHSLLKDFEDEVSGYLNNKKICDLILSLDLKSGKSNIENNIFKCYEALTENNFIGKQEMHLVECWIEDLKLSL